MYLCHMTLPQSAQEQNFSPELSIELLTLISDSLLNISWMASRHQVLHTKTKDYYLPLWDLVLSCKFILGWMYHKLLSRKLRITMSSFFPTDLFKDDYWFCILSASPFTPLLFSDIASPRLLRCFPIFPCLKCSPCFKASSSQMLEWAF